MHKRRFIPLLLSLLALAQGGTTTGWSAATDEPVEVRIVFEVLPNPPRSLGWGTAIDWDKPGLTPELLRRVGEQLGINVTFKRVPWKRGLFLLQTGEADGIFHASYRTERTEFGVYPMKDGHPDESRRIFTQSYTFFTLKDSPLSWDGKTLEPADAVIGAVNSYSVVADLREQGYRVDEAKNQQINLDKLINGRIDAYAGLENMVEVLLARDPYTYRDVVKLSPPFRSKPYYLLLSKRFYRHHPQLAEAIWDEIARVNASEAFRTLIDDYLD